jgi:NAD(P)-dependent dehydrogenase (short-subunit alcohol dehydrogenase family)
VVITGGGRGQGRAHALGFAAAGADIVICEPDKGMTTAPYELGGSEELNATAADVEALGARCLPAICDVRDRIQVEAMFGDALTEFGRVDVLINNAGISSLPSVAEMTELEWDEMLDTGLKGVFLCSQAATRAMADRGEGGRVITTGSTASVVGLPRHGHYCAAKHGVVGFSKALAIEVAEHDITVNVVLPGGVDTPMVAGIAASPQAEWLQTLGELAGPFNLFRPGEMMASEEITAAMLWLASDAARFVTGAVLPVDAGYTAK